MPFSALLFSHEFDHNVRKADICQEQGRLHPSFPCDSCSSGLHSSQSGLNTLIDNPIETEKIAGRDREKEKGEILRDSKRKEYGIVCEAGSLLSVALVSVASTE